MKAIFYLNLNPETNIEENLQSAPQAQLSKEGLWQEAGLVPTRFFESSQDLFKKSNAAKKMYSRVQNWLIFRLLMKGADTYDLIKKIAQKLEAIGRPITDAETSVIKSPIIPDAIWVGYHEVKRHLVLLGTLEKSAWKDAETFLANNVFKNNALLDNHLNFDELHIKMDPLFRQLKEQGYDVQGVTTRDEKDQEVKAKAQKSLAQSRKNAPVYDDLEEDKWDKMQMQGNAGKVLIGLTKSGRHYLQIAFPRFEDGIVILELEKILPLLVTLREKGTKTTKLTF